MAKICNGTCEVEIPDGISLSEASFSVNLEAIGLEFACHIGRSGCCRVKLLKGAENLEAVNPGWGINGAFFDSVGDGFILPCCVAVKSGAIEIDSDDRFKFFCEE